MQPKALLIDFDGVIRHWPPLGAGIERRLGFAAELILQTAFSPDLLLPAIKGEVSDAEWRENVALRLGAMFGRELAREAVAAWSASPGEIDATTLAIIERCVPHLRPILVTNATSRLPDDLAALGLGSRFSAVVNSSVLGTAKPAPAFFHAALRTAGTAPGETLYVDDSEANVVAATALGIVSHRFTNHRGLEAFLEANSCQA